MNNEFEPLSKAPLQVWVNSHIQLFDAVAFCAKDMGGNCHMTVTTFSNSEEFLRRLFRLKQQKLIKHAVLVCDFRAMEKTFKLMRFIQNVYDEVYLTKNHSKIILLENDHKKVAILSSQNQTRGNRAEHGSIITDLDSYNQLQQEINTILKYAFRINGKST